MNNCTVIPFPLKRRKVMIDRVARYASEMDPAAAERLFRCQLKIQAEVLQRRGVESEIIDRELEGLAHALREKLTETSANPGAQ